MARGSTPTLLPLDRWFEIMGVHPFSANQLNGTTLAPPSNCGEVWFQYMYQNPDQAAREDVADAIREAELKIASEIGYFPLPDWVVEERLLTVRPARPELYAGTVGTIRGQAKSVNARWAIAIAGGHKKKDEIAVDVVANGVTLSDEDGDLYKETVTIAVNIAAHPGITACEVRVFYPDTEGVIDRPALDEWEVRPIRVTIAGVNATITFKRWQIVSADEQARLDSPLLDSTLDPSYLTTVDVYRVWNDPQSMATMLWDRSGPTTCQSCSGSGCVACGFNSQTACLFLRDKRLGIFAYQPATWDEDDEQFILAAYANCRDPDQIIISYYSGYESQQPNIDCPRVQMDPFFEKVIAYYAAAILDRDVCSCNNSERFIDHWREDLARVGSEVSFQISPQDLDNPLGTQRGAIYAWKQIRRGDWRVHR
jgi:hypothetical protein